MVSYTRDGVDRWKLLWGLFDNFYGRAHPLFGGDKVIWFVISRMARRDRVGRGGAGALEADACGGCERSLDAGAIQACGRSLGDSGSFRMDAYQAIRERFCGMQRLASEMKSVPLVFRE